MTNFRITEPDKVPEEFKKLVKSPNGRFDSSVGLVPDEAKIRAALDGTCERCGGTGKFDWRENSGDIDNASSQDYISSERRAYLNNLDCRGCHGSGHPEIPGVQRVKNAV